MGYLLISLLASIAGAISGIGGGVIIKPVLDTLSPFDVVTISFLSGTTVFSMSVVTLIRNRKSEVNLNRATAGLLAAGSIAGGLTGKCVFDLVKIRVEQIAYVTLIQSALLILLTLFVFVFTLKKESITPRHNHRISVTLLIGFILGCLASFLGIGGGPINLAILYFFFSMDSKTAALNSIYIIFFSQITNLIFTTLSGRIPDFDPPILAMMIGGGIMGGMIGSHFSRKMSHRAVDRLFMGVMAVIIAICCYNFAGSALLILS